MLKPTPKKRFGQHFLHDEKIVARIMRCVPVSAPEAVIEIGAGTGALTAHLVERARRVVAVEYDRELVPLLRERFGARENFTLVEADALDVDFCALVEPDARAWVVANLPYNIGTAILMRLIEQRACLAEMVLMLQREVAERITAPPSEPGNKRSQADGGERSYLSVFVEAYCEAERLFDVPPGAFRPPPKVWSSVVRLRPRAAIGVEVEDETLLWQVVSAGFMQRRKTIYNNLRSAPPPLRERIERHAGGATGVLRAADVDGGRRAETLTLAEWGRIANATN